MKIDDTNRVACTARPLRDRCTKSFRQVSRLENEAVLDQMATRLAARPDILDWRRESGEYPFGTIKQWMNQGAFLMRRLDNVGGEFSLMALAYNIRRDITIGGVPGLIAALRA
ncbi:transposase [Microvirga sp. VF16]|uniref:transposase n=1 Tax=Microvirga sp. VF16 TaxID=2807101 RepID=UPI001FEE9E53|nr:transposase [Microvirga sp. VF16]